eukprot:CAMPEP_0185755496 /NCGR_PEP_ID=MMETSP1174-20130828/13981_1 /TAXON_ID=35687 /ORGANISM="Dictyocha speculum, Strain CCMP1381" /LENGTH=120 /DNA_ID=CAMNT_0028434061 /DNA_START=393 /DNA_END=755 /DNA_ORIENTATION=+
MAAPSVQYLFPVFIAGVLVKESPSKNKSPKWPPQLMQRTSAPRRLIWKALTSSTSIPGRLSAKEGHPVPELNFSSLENSFFLQHHASESEVIITETGHGTCGRLVPATCTAISTRSLFFG